MTDFQKGLLWTAAPLVLLGLVSTAGFAAGGKAQGPSAGVWYVGLLAWVIAMVVLVVLAVGGKRRFIPGMVAGLALGFLALSATCFANLALLNPR